MRFKYKYKFQFLFFFITLVVINKKGPQNKNVSKGVGVVHQNLWHEGIELRVEGYI
jgi:hypothetical protein